VLNADDAALQVAIQGHMRQTAEIFGERSSSGLDGTKPTRTYAGQDGSLRTVRSQTSRGITKRGER
jgi:hypothetical protein